MEPNPNAVNAKPETPGEQAGREPPRAMADPFADYPFARDWTAGHGAARQLMPWLSGADAPAWRAAVAARDARPAPALGPDAIRQIQDYNGALGNPVGARLAARLAQPGALAIVTGQQPNLLASPLYILYKALTAWAMAKALQAELGGGRPVVPIFWVASDDHDFQELRSCIVPLPGGGITGLTDGMEARRAASHRLDGGVRDLGELVSRGANTPPSSPAYEWDLAESAPRLRQAAAEAFPGAAGRVAAALVHRALREPGACGRVTFESAFGRVLAALLGDSRAVVMVAPRLPFLRQGGAPILRASFENPALAGALVADRAAAMADAGYRALLHRVEGVLDAFLIHGRSRLRLSLAVPVAPGQRPHPDAEVRATDPATRAIVLRMKHAELLHELDRAPQRFSPNVVTRPMVQDAVLPIVAYVGGPGEVGYLAQLGPVYEAFHTPRAAVTLRASATLVDDDTAAALAALGLPPDLAGLDARALMDRLLAADPETGKLLDGTRELEARLAAGLEALRFAPGARHPHVEIALEKTGRAMRHALDRLRGRLGRRLAAEGTAAWRTTAAAAGMLSPVGKPQERVLSPLAFLKGREEPEDLTRTLLAKLDFGASGGQVVRV